MQLKIENIRFENNNYFFSCGDYDFFVKSDTFVELELILSSNVDVCFSVENWLTENNIEYGVQLKLF
jgi:hypothetical protein